MGNQTSRGFIASVMFCLSLWSGGPREAGRREVDRTGTRKESGTGDRARERGFGYRSSWQTKSSWVARSWARRAGVRVLLTWVVIEKVSDLVPSAVAAISWV